jgi:hypothetical protein
MTKIQQERRLLVAVRTKDNPRLTTKTVERTRKRLCEERLKPLLARAPKNNVAGGRTYDGVIGACAEQGRASPIMPAGFLSLTGLFLCNKRHSKGYCAIGIVGL